MDPVALVPARGGAARAEQLRRGGATRTALAAALADGRLVRRASGLYALPGCEPGPLAAAAVGGVLSCLDAASAHGLTVLRPVPVVHLVAPRGSQRTWPVTLVHRRGLPVGGGPLPLVRTLRAVAHCHPLATAVSFVDEALRTGRCSASDLAAEHAAVRRDPLWRAVLAAADPRAGSAIESLARIELVEALRGTGVVIELQVCLRGVGAVDLLVDGWLVVELDGYAFHADRASYRRDRHRDQVLSSSGYVWLRFAFEDVVRSQGQLADRVLQTWSRGRPPGFRDLRTGGR